MKTRKQALQDEFNDLEAEFYFCGSRDERRRCANRMQAILAELSTVTPAPTSSSWQGQGRLSRGASSAGAVTLHSAFDIEGMHFFDIQTGRAIRTYPARG